MIKKILMSLASLAFFFALTYNITLGASLIIIAIIFMIFFKSTTNKSFLKLQEKLPTTPIRRLKEGLVEIRGKIRCESLIPTKIGNDKCVAYEYYLTEEIKNFSGDRETHVLESDKQITPFSIQDGMDSVDINIEGLDLLWLPQLGSFKTGKLSYQQRVLMPGDEVILIGKATNINGKMIIERDLTHNVFNLAMASSVNKWNKYKGLRRSFYLFLGLSCIAAMLITIFVDVSVSNGIITYRFNPFLGN